MKKGFFSFAALLITMLFASPALAYEAEVSSVDAVYLSETDCVSVTTEISGARDVVMFAGIFDGDIPVSVDTESFKTLDSSQDIIRLHPSAANLTEGKDYTIKVFFWDETMQPLYPSQILEYTFTDPKASEVSFDPRLFCDFGEGWMDEKSSLTVYNAPGSAETTTYILDDKWEPIINGVSVPQSWIGDNELMYTGKDVVLKDFNGDGLYDMLSAAYYCTAVVSDVYEDGEGIYVYFLESSENAYGFLIPNDGSTTVSITKDGRSISPLELNEFDTLTISYDPQISDLDYAEFLEITVSDTKLRGAVYAAGKDDYGETCWTINGEKYAESPRLSLDIEEGTEYTVCVSDIGRAVYAYDKNANPINYGFLETAYKAEDGNIMVRLTDKNGVRHEYAADESANYDPDGKIEELLWLSDAGMGDTPMRGEWIVDYSISPDNKISLRSSDIRVSLIYNEPYDAEGSSLGGIKLADGASVLDACRWHEDMNAEITYLTGSELTGGEIYSCALAWDPTREPKNTAAFAVIFPNLPKIETEHSMAAVTSSTFEVSDGSVFSVLEDGEEKELTARGADGLVLAYGDVILYGTDDEGYVDEIYKVLNFRPDTLRTGKYDYLRAAVNGTAINPDLPQDTFLGDRVEFVLAPVVSAGSNYIELGNVRYGDVGNKPKTEGKNAYYMIEGDTEGYIFYELARLTALPNTGFYMEVTPLVSPTFIRSSIIVSPSIAHTSYLDYSGIYINLGMEEEYRSINSVAFALLRVADGLVLDAYTILPYPNTNADFISPDAQ